MIIDKIQERQHGDVKYKPRDFYYEMLNYQDTGGDIIADAMDGGTEQDVKQALYLYIVEQEYNIDFCKYIKSVKWL